MDDAERFDRLYREHADPVFRFCLRRTGDWVLADDLRSAVFVEAWRRRNEVDLESRAPLPWLFGVAANVLRNERRARRRYDAALRRVPVAVADPAPVEEEILDRIDASARAAKAIAALDALPAGQRDVVRLCLASDVTYRDAARALGLPVGTVRSRVARAREALAQRTREICEADRARRAALRATPMTERRR